MKVTAKAHSNIALIKYWGKRQQKLNLPAVGSVSLTLDALFTVTGVNFEKGLKADLLQINGEPAKGGEGTRVSRFLDIIREMSGISLAARVTSRNNFPTAAGLASSASAFAALALAASKAAGLELTPAGLSALARRGSGSAARSIFGGIVEMHKGVKDDGTDAIAEPIAAKNDWDLRLLIAVTARARKKTGSTDGMKLSAETSPYYKAWIATAESDLAQMRGAIKARDFKSLGELSEYSCLKMHALALSSRPGLIYWNGVTLNVMQHIRNLRGKGIPVYFTVDAGPQVKALCQAGYTNVVKESLLGFPGVLEVLESALGGPAEIIEVEHD